MYKLKDLVLSSEKPVYVYLSDDKTAKQFLIDAEKQGFVFPDGEKPTDKHISDFFALHPDMSMNYLGVCGRIAYQCGAENIIRVDCKKLCASEDEL